MEKDKVHLATDAEHEALCTISRSEAMEFFYCMDKKVTMVTTIPSPKGKDGEDMLPDDIANALFGNILISTIRIKNVLGFDGKTVLAEVFKRLLDCLDTIDGVQAKTQLEKRLINDPLHETSTETLN